MPKYLIDRSLGGRDLQAVLLAKGEQVERVGEHFPHDDESGVDDADWLAFAGEEGYVVLSKDGNMRRLAHERQVICEHGLLIFCVTNQQVPGPEIIQRYESNWKNISELAAAADGPAFYGVGSEDLVLLDMDCESVNSVGE